MISFPRIALSFLAITLASSAALRIGFGVGEALALSPDPAEQSDAPLQCPEPPIAVVQALADREALLASREAALEQRLAALDLAETAIATRMADLQKAEADLAALIQVADGAAEEDLVRLTAVYEAMKPSDAARLFTAMSPDFAAGFLGRMRPDSAAQVLAGMEPDAAFAISALIAGRNALAPSD